MWHDGYLEQARSDWDVYNTLSMSSIPDCHALHYLLDSGEFNFVGEKGPKTRFLSL